MATKPECIYLDYQASTPVDEAVFDVYIDISKHCFANPHASEHILGWYAGKELKKAQAIIAQNLDCEPEEVIFTSGATEANNLAILGFAEASHATRKRILIGAIEHKCVIQAAKLAFTRFGHAVEMISVDRFGVIDLEALASMMGPDVLVVSVMHVNNEVGSVQPIPEIAELAVRHGAFMHSDAVHALTCSPLSFHESGIHAMSLSGHKIYGPKGVGALIVRRDAQEAIRPQIVGGGQQSGLRAGTVALPLCTALAKATELICGERAAAEREVVSSLRDRFAAKLLENPRVEINGPELRRRHPGNLNLRFARLECSRSSKPLAAAGGGIERLGLHVWHA